MSGKAPKKLARQVAVALGYDPQSNDPPKVLAKGQGKVAEKIMELAKEQGIPVHEDSDLAEVLVALDLNQNIPPETYPVIAEILAYIYKQNEKFGKQKRI